MAKQTRKKPGAPKGNQNARRRHPRVKLDVRVEQSMREWLQRQADREGTNIGRWLDDLAYKRT